MNLKKLMLLGTLVIGAMISAPATANAYSFYWSKVEVQTASWQNCMRFAHAAASKHNMSQLKQDNLAVTGSRNGANATLTCIGTGGNSKAMAVVMVVGESDGPVRQLRDELVATILREQMLD